MRRSSRFATLLCAAALACAIGPAVAQEADDGRPLPPADVSVAPEPQPPVPVADAQRASRRGYVVLAVGGGVVAAFVLLAISGFFKRPDA